MDYDSKNEMLKALQIGLRVLVKLERSDPHIAARHGASLSALLSRSDIVAEIGGIES
jgi:hypothetical protein